MVKDVAHAIRIYRRDLWEQRIDDDQARMPDEFHSQEINGGVELHDHKGLIAFVNEEEEVVDADDYLIDNPDRD